MASPQELPEQPLEFRKKDGSVSRMRSHKGNLPVLPQTKVCPYCPAKFTRTTHLNRHLRNHTNERPHLCEHCGSDFTRTDLLARHKKNCTGQADHPRRRSCIRCTESKVKCDRQFPCSKCIARGRECVFPSPRRKASANRSTIATSSSDFGVASLPNASMPSPPPSLPRQAFSDASSSIGGNLGVISDTVTETETEAPFYGQLSALYSNDMFQSFFTGIFSSPTMSSAQSPADSQVWPESSQVRDDSPDDSFFFPVGNANISPRILGSDIPPHISSFSLPQLFEPVLPATTLSLAEVSDAEIQHYVYIFFSSFVIHMPMVHTPTFTAVGKPEILKKAIQACGALFVKTRDANKYITSTLESCKEALVEEFANAPSDSDDVVYLVLAVVLLQTIGLFHQQPEQRSSATNYHSLLVMIIRRAGLMARSAAWMPSGMEVPLERQWRNWACAETMKRALTLAYLHDCCQHIYFASTPSFHPNEMLLNLPCESALWNAKTADEWYAVLKGPTTYGSTHLRLTGVNFSNALAYLSQPRPMSEPAIMTPFGHFVLAHAICRELFSLCTSDPATASEAPAHIYRLQYALHNWLECWMASPDLPNVQKYQDIPFMDNALTFYWLGQIALMAHQEGIPPFERHSQMTSPERRHRLIKKWLRHIRCFLQHSDKSPTLFWDELMKIRLQSWESGVESDSAAETSDGLLGFFPN